MGWVCSYANAWEGYSNYLREGAGISRNWATTHFLAIYSQTQNCHGSCGYVLNLLMYYDEYVIRLKVH